MMRAVLTYHSIDEHGSPISVDPESFARHVAFLGSSSVDVVPLAEIASASGGSKPTVALTFDDGLESFSSKAWPLLRDSGLPVSLFVVTERVGGTNAWNELPSIPTQRLLDWDELGLLTDQGVTIGNHSRIHSDLTQLAPSELEDEIGGAAQGIKERLGVTCESFAYPYGHVNSAVTEAVRGHHKCAVTTEMALLSDDDPLLLPRVDAFYLGAEGRIEGFGRSRFARFVRWRSFLRRIRRVGG